MGEYALLVSVASLAVALTSLTWNIWSKFVFPKPHLECWGFRIEDDPDDPDTMAALAIWVLNHGPGDISLTALRAIFPDNKRATFDNMFLDPKKLSIPFDLQTERMPRSLKAGEECHFFIPDLADAPDLYVRDFYDRHHLVRAWPIERGPPGDHLPLLQNSDEVPRLGYFLHDEPEQPRPGFWSRGYRAGKHWVRSHLGVNREQ